MSRTVSVAATHMACAPDAVIAIGSEPHNASILAGKNWQRVQQG